MTMMTRRNLVHERHISPTICTMHFLELHLLHSALSSTAGDDPEDPLYVRKILILLVEG